MVAQVVVAVVAAAGVIVAAVMIAVVVAALVELSLKLDQFELFYDCPPVADIYDAMETC